MVSEYSNLPAGALLQGGKYYVEKVLGQGGFGITYLAEQTGLGMKVAIKEFFLKGSCQRDSTTSEVSVPVTNNKGLFSKCQKKFKSEARKIASLNNDHIVNIIDIFDENGTSYYVMKYLKGGSLADKVKDRPMPERDALRVIYEISDALVSIHSRGLLHLDIKPANILFDERDRAVLIDFGISKYLDSQDDTTTTSSLVGFSRGFAPLEQANANISSLTKATDLYALGATLYNLVTGDAPPEASEVMMNGLPTMSSEISEKVKKAISSTMQPKKTDRPQDVQSFLKLLPQETDYSDDEVTVIVPGNQGTLAPSPAPSTGRIWRIVTTSLLCATLVFGVLLLLQNKGSGHDESGKIETLTEANEGLQKQVNALQSEEKTLTQTNNSLHKQVDDLQGQVSTQKSKNSALQKENAELKSLVDKYKPAAENWWAYEKTQK